MKLERDPKDGKIAMFPAEISFDIEDLGDVYLVLTRLKKAAELFKETHGYTGYPVYRVEEE